MYWNFDFKMFVIIYTVLCRNPELKFSCVIEVDKVRYVLIVLENFSTFKLVLTDLVGEPSYRVVQQRKQTAKSFAVSFL